MTQIEALKAIAERNGGLLRPQAVVDEARDEKSPLHSAFEWNDGVAAEKYRLDQAQRLIRSFRVVCEENGKKVEVPMFIGISTDRLGGRGENPYRLASDVAKSQDLMAVAERDALDQLRGLRDRYSHLRRLNDIWSVIDSHK